MSILEAIASNVQAHPERLAYVVNTREGSQSLTWRQLGEQSDRLATYISQYVPGNVPVVVYGHKDPLMIVSFLACSKSGRAYCPVDTSVPAGRLQDIVREVVPSLVIAAEPLPEVSCGNALVLDKCDLERIVAQDGAASTQSLWLGPDDVYYIIFTSGSTGKPKGVQITRDCLDNFVAWGQTLCANAAEQGYVFVNQAPYSFDLSVMDLYLSLSLGGTEFALEKKLLESMATLFERLHTSGATVWVSTPSFAEMCLADPSFSQELLPSMRAMLFCGETLTNRCAERLLEAFPQAEVYNTYGPTESTVAVTGVRVTRDVSQAFVPLPVGTPKPGTSIRIVDADGNEVAPGQKGEIQIVGDSVSVGYFHDHERTAKAFSTHELNGQTMRAYRTGDEGYLQDGMLFYSGRIDLQIKMNGYRIELEDIEANIAKIAGVVRVCVLPVRRPDGSVRSLTAYLVMDRPASSYSSKELRGLRKELASDLPAYMIPKRLRVMDDLPVTNNGKVDRKALAAL
ncbi:MAG: D-alanine--poly(phosphoribitol) ligase subunit DltA [Coriobacteriales bacterium]|nr:D-alanine--poly(phosphoribitol) ligase subunit DltA [Coriobacteriales bacterium]